MHLVVDPQGQVRCLYSEVIDLTVLGSLTITRASQVEPDSDARWWADLCPVTGPKLGPFVRRSEALDAETNWLNNHWLEPFSSQGDCNGPQELPVRPGQ
jgi:hypothetical protein